MSIVANPVNVQYPAEHSYSTLVRSTNDDNECVRRLNRSIQLIRRQYTQGKLDEARFRTELEKVQNNCTISRKKVMNKELHRLAMYEEPTGEWVVASDDFDTDDEADDGYCHPASNIEICGMNCLKCGDYIPEFKSKDDYIKLLASLGLDEIMIQARVFRYRGYQDGIVCKCKH